MTTTSRRKAVTPMTNPTSWHGRIHVIEVPSDGRGRPHGALPGRTDRSQPGRQRAKVIAMPRLCMITVPEFDVRSDWRLVHDRLVEDFPEVSDVLATTIAATVLVVYEGPDQSGAWLDSIVEAVRTRRCERLARGA